MEKLTSDDLFHQPHKHAPRVFVFCGQKQSGKGTAAKLLAELLSKRGTNPLVVDFADALRDVVARVFGVDGEAMARADLKEVPLNRWPFLSPREILQRVGTDVFRYYWPDVWVEAWSREATRHLSTSPGAVVISTDCRFPNEGARARSIDPACIVVQMQRETGLHDTHASETSYLDIVPTHVMENNGSLRELEAEVQALVQDVFGS